MKVTQYSINTRSRLGGTGRELLNTALQRNPVVAIAASVVGSLLRLLGSKSRASGARYGSYNIKRVRTSYDRSSSRKKQTTTKTVSRGRVGTLNLGGRRHG
jgi:hypothetical protein